MHSFHHATLAILPFGAALFAAPFPTAAQEADSEITSDRDAARSARIYTYEQLAQYAPQTALDMLNRIPGFAIDESNQGNRGLGQARQNILVNGERVSGKSNDAVSTLSRIDAQKVLRIEILDGATLDVPGLSGEVANIVYEAGGISGTWRYNAQLRPTIEDTLLDGSATLSGGGLNDSWSVSFASNARHQGHWGPETVFGPEGDILIERDEVGRYNGHAPRIAGNYARSFVGGSELNVNAAAQFDRKRNRVTGEIVTSEGERFEELFIGGADDWNAEVGGDYAFGAFGGRLKLIGLRRMVHSPTYDQFGTVGGNAQRFERTVDEGESILRGEYGIKTGATDWGLSLEGAYNRLESESAFLLLPPDGPAQRIDLDPNDIGEQRADSILSMSRPLSPRLSLQLNGGAEFSRIEAGDAAPRSYFRPKGSAALSWRASDTVTLDAKLERVVDQLDFYDFLASLNVQDDLDRDRNNDIVPPQRWRARVESVVKLGAYGSVTPYVQGERIEDVIEAIPVSPTEEALGNAGSATAWLVGGDGTLLFEPIGIEGARLDVHMHTGNSSFIDPLLLTSRSLNNQEFTHFRLQYRHDLPGSQIAYGGSFDTFHSLGELRLDQYQRGFKPRPMTDVFIEHKDVLGMQLRLTFINLLGSSDGFERTVYVDRRDGPIAFTEFRDRDFGQLLFINLSGSI